MNPGKLELPRHRVRAGAREALPSAMRGKALARGEHRAHDLRGRGLGMGAMGARVLTQSGCPCIVEAAAPFRQPLAAGAELARHLTRSAPFSQHLDRAPTALGRVHCRPPRRLSPSRKMSPMMWRFAVSDDLSGTRYQIFGTASSVGRCDPCLVAIDKGEAPYERSDRPVDLWQATATVAPRRGSGWTPSPRRQRSELLDTEMIDQRMTTWSYLLPADVDFVHAGESRFIDRDSLQGAMGGRKVLVAWEKSIRDLPGPGNFFALILVNCRGVTTRLLSEMGFASVSHFAILPGVEDARWFLPLGAGNFSAEAFRWLYRPYRPGARLKHGAVRAAARAGLPFWYRDHVYVAQRTASPLETTLEGVLESSGVRLGLFAGAPGLQKPTFVVLDSAGKALAFAKLATEQSARTHLEREKRTLLRLAGMPDQHSLAPRLLFEGVVDERYVTVQTPLEGRSGPARLLDAHERFLDCLRGRQKRSAGSTEFIRSLAEGIESLESAQERGFLAGILARLRPALDSLLIPTTIVHGDFAPWNLRYLHDRISAFDWERSSVEGIPLVDALQHQLQVGFLLRNWSVTRALEHLMWIGSTYPLGLERSDVGTLATAGMLNYLLRQIEDGKAHGTLARNYRELIGRAAGLVGDGSSTRWE